MRFAQPDAESFFTGLMNDAIKSREESKVQRADFLDHLINLRNKKEVSGLLLLT